jgi:hypothetical protein
MPQPSGFSLSLSLPRRLMCDYLHFSRKVPTVPVQRRMRLADVVAARAAAAARPSWSAIFTKAYAIVSAACPLLRRSYLTFPWARLYQHPVNILSIPIERRFGEEDAVFFVHVRQPERLSLVEIDRRLRSWKEVPLESVAAFRRELRLSRLPGPLRRMVWWVGLNVSGRKRGQYFGTAGLTTYGGLGAASLHPQSLLTTTLNYNVIQADGSVEVRLTYDHRVMDGSTVARALADLEGVLCHEIVAELRYLRAAAAA